jgi:hypothetical protein
MKIGRCSLPLGGALVGALVIMNGWPSAALAQDHDGHAVAAQSRPQTPADKARENALVKIVREATQGFKDVAAAEGAGYALQFGCVSGGDYGAMGLHFINGALVNDGELDATRPEIVLYEPSPYGGYRRCLARQPRRAAGTERTAVSSVREPQSLRTAAVLHAACVGLERQSQWHVHELESQRLVRRLQPTLRA